MTTPVRGFRDLHALSTLLKACFCGCVAVAVVSAWAGWTEIGILQRLVSGGYVPDAEALASDERQGTVGALYLIVYGITAIAFLRFVYVANENARALGARGMRFSPGWSVGWYFVPLAWWWKPYEAMRETLRASDPDRDGEWNRGPDPAVLAAWWTLWLLSSIAGQVAFRLDHRARTVEAAVDASWASFVSDLLDLPTVLLAWLLIASLHGLQNEKHRRLQAGAPANATPPI